MINTDRIVPVTKTDLLTLYHMIMSISGAGIYLLQPTAGAAGGFVSPSAVTAGKTLFFATEPVRQMVVYDDFLQNGGAIFFVGAYDFDGISNESGTAIDNVVDGSEYGTFSEALSDGCTLWVVANDGQESYITPAWKWRASGESEPSAPGVG